MSIFGPDFLNAVADNIVIVGVGGSLCAAALAYTLYSLFRLSGVKSWGVNLVLVLFSVASGFLVVSVLAYHDSLVSEVGKNAYFECQDNGVVTYTGRADGKVQVIEYGKYQFVEKGTGKEMILPSNCIVTLESVEKVEGKSQE